MSEIKYSVDEIIELIKRSNLINLLVEGTADSAIYRKVENKIKSMNVDIIQCGGRTQLFEIFKRKKEFTHSKVIFLADKDSYVYSRVPTKFNEIIWTNGYSIENDLLNGSHILELFDESELILFDEYIDIVINWFGFLVDKYLFCGNTDNFACHFLKFCDIKQKKIYPSVANEYSYIPPNDATIAKLKSNYLDMIRGKTLIDIIVSILSEKKRKSKYSRNNIIEICSVDENNNLYKLVVPELLKRIND